MQTNFTVHGQPPQFPSLLPPPMTAGEVYMYETEEYSYIVAMYMDRTKLMWFIIRLMKLDLQFLAQNSGKIIRASGYYSLVL